SAGSMKDRKKNARTFGASSANNCRKATSSPPTYWAISLSSVVVAACDMPAGMSHLAERSLEFIVGLLRFDALAERHSMGDPVRWGTSRAHPGASRLGGRSGSRTSSFARAEMLQKIEP